MAGKSLLNVDASSPEPTSPLVYRKPLPSPSARLEKIPLALPSWDILSYPRGVVSPRGVKLSAGGARASRSRRLSLLNIRLRRLRLAFH